MLGQLSLLLMCFWSSQTAAFSCAVLPYNFSIQHRSHRSEMEQLLMQVLFMHLVVLTAQLESRVTENWTESSFLCQNSCQSSSSSCFPAQLMVNARILLFHISSPFCAVIILYINQAWSCKELDQRWLRTPLVPSHMCSSPISDFFFWAWGQPS